MGSDVGAVGEGARVGLLDGIFVGAPAEYVGASDGHPEG